MKLHRFLLLLTLGAGIVIFPHRTWALAIQIGDFAGPPGTTGIVVSVEVDDAAGIAGGDLTLAFNPAVLRAQNVSGSPLLAATGIALVSSIRSGEVRVSLAGATGIVAGEGELFSVSFDILSDARMGNYTLDLSRAVFRDEQAQLLLVESITGGQVIVEGNDEVRAPPSDAGLEVGIESVLGRAGDKSVEVAITVRGALRLAGGDFILSYDPTVLQATRVAAGELALSAGVAILANTATQGQVKISLAGATGLSSGNGTLATLIFNVDDNAAPGRYRLEFTQVVLRDEAAAVLPVVMVEAGIFTVRGGSTATNVADATWARVKTSFLEER